MLTVLAGPDANAFVARYGDQLFSTEAFWKDFKDAMNMDMERDGDANRQRRARVGRSYSRARVLDQLPRMIEITHEFTQDWQPGAKITALPSMQRIVAEQLGQLLVNYGPGDYLEDFVTFLHTSVESAFNKDAAATAALSSPEFLHAKERAYELGRIILEVHLATPVTQRKHNLMDDVLADAAKMPEKYPQNVLERAGIGPLLAGLETVANTSSRMFYALLKYPEVLERVLAEVDAVFAQGPLTWETLKGMHALHGAAMETLRLYSGGGHMMRVIKPFTFAGYRLEPGDDVLVAMTVAHFLPELFAEPETFDIDRYHDPRNEHRQRGAYAPFGLGDHTCLGAGIAEIQLMVIVATLLHTYRLALDDEFAAEDSIALLPIERIELKVVVERS
jgi:cytochrome P450